MADDEQDFVEMVSAINDGWVRAMGLRFTRATRKEVVAELDVRPEHHQPYGIVHGGVHAGIIETLASVGAALHAIPEGKSVVGLENHTSFLRAVREGKLVATARPVAAGRRSHVWEAEVRDGNGKLAATGRVRLLLLEGDAEIAGRRVEVPGGKQG
jgi:1,4-dihydroxy-2-naphthoyl-CoA hydrolase